MASNMQRSTLQKGAMVVSAGGEQLGTVKEVQGDRFKVDAPNQPDYWLSLNAVTIGAGGQVIVADGHQSAGPDTVNTDTGRLTDYRATDTHTTEQDRVVLREEQLGARKVAEEAGEVGIRKEVVSQQQTVEVPVRREEVFIERRPLNGEPTPGEITNEAEEIRVPVMEERAELEKRTVATAEVGIGKRTVEETERLTGTVRREEARIEVDGDLHPVHEVNGQEHIAHSDHQHGNRG